MVASLFKGLGGLLGDTAEGIKWLGDEVSEIPQALEDGWNEGLMVTPSEPDYNIYPEQTVTTEELQKQIDALFALQKAQESTKEE